MSDRMKIALVSTFGLGFMRPASGTWGSLPPPAMLFGMILLGAPVWAQNAALLGVLAFSSACCLALGGWAERHFGKKDSGHIVADETAGQCLPLLLLPAAATATPARAMLTLGAAFVLFRVMDIIKPPPARGLQRLHGGVGVLIDDLFAGVYAAIIVQVGVRMIYAPGAGGLGG